MLFSYDRAILQLKLKKVKTLIWELPCMLGWLLLVACNAQPANERQAGTQPDIFPDYIGVTVPVDIAPLNFAMADDSVSSIDVTVKGSLGGSIHVAHLSVSVAACREGRWTRYRIFLINVGNDSIGARSITYRRIAPGYEQYGHMGIYKRNLASFDETVLVDNSSRPGMCVNCHTNNGGNGEQYVFHARNENGGTFIKHNGKLARVVIDKKSTETRLEILRRALNEVTFGTWNEYGYTSSRDVDFDTIIDIDTVTKQVDECAEKLRKLTSEIEKLNVSTEI